MLLMNGCGRRACETQFHDFGFCSCRFERYKVGFISVTLLSLLFSGNIETAECVCLAESLTHLFNKNIGNAKVAGMETDLNLQSGEFNTALSIFYVGYVIGEVPSNMAVSLFFVHKPTSNIPCKDQVRLAIGLSFFC